MVQPVPSGGFLYKERAMFGMDKYNLEWMHHGKCSNDKTVHASQVTLKIDPFYPDKINKGSHPERYCSGCPVIQQCLQHAIENDEDGVWGGTTAKGRRRLRNNAHKRALELLARLNSQLPGGNEFPNAS